MTNRFRKISVLVLAVFFPLSPMFVVSSMAGTLEFDGVPVDITTADNEDLVIVPGTDGNTQVGTGTTNVNATTNNDLYISGVLEADGVIYSDGGIVSGNSIVPGTTASYNLGTSTKYWSNAYITNIYAGDIAKIKDIAYSWPSAQGAASSVLSNNGSGTLSWTSLSSGAPVGASYITQTANDTLSGEQALSSLGTGLMKVTTTTGVISSVKDSAGVAALLSDETGSGALVFGTSATITTPIIRGETVLPISGGATDASLGNIFTFSSTADATLLAPTNPTKGQKCIWRWTNSDSSSHSLSLATGAGGFRFGSTLQSLTATAAGKTDYIGAVYNDTDSRWDVIAYAKGY